MSKKVYLIEDVKTKEVYTAEEWAEMNEVAGITRKLNTAHKDNPAKTIRVKSDDPILTTKLSTPWLKPPRTLCLYIMPDFNIIAAREDHAPEGYRVKILASKRTYETAGKPGTHPVPGWFGREREPKKKVPTSDVLLGE
jgi:hypothetical protein